MRRWLVLLLVFIVLLASFIYLLLPGNIPLHKEKLISVKANTFSRMIIDESVWKEWWPGGKEGNNSINEGYTYNGYHYRILEKKLSSLLISIKKGNDSLLTEFVFIPEDDTIEINWVGRTTAAFNPITRIQNFWETKTISANIDTLLQKLQSFFSNEKNLYGINIQKERVVDSTLISTSITESKYPTTQIIYDMIDHLKFFAQKNGAKQTGFPMLNILPNSDSTYLTRVALPVDKILKDSGNIHYRWMLGGGNILITEVRGGTYQIKQAFAGMNDYVNDYHRIAPAIPFQSLVTDRRNEPDTNKWVTKIYWPVM